MLVEITSDDHEWHWAAISSQQIAAASRPGQRTSELVGNFDDLLRLIDQLAEPMDVIELGKPLPEEGFLPKPRIGSCPAAHNRALLDDEGVAN